MQLQQTVVFPLLDRLGVVAGFGTGAGFGPGLGSRRDESECM
jgi:hypothetical protein